MIHFLTCIALSRIIWNAFSIWQQKQKLCSTRQSGRLIIADPQTQKWQSSKIPHAVKIVQKHTWVFWNSTPRNKSTETNLLKSPTTLDPPRVLWCVIKWWHGFVSKTWWKPMSWETRHFETGWTRILHIPAHTKHSYHSHRRESPVALVAVHQCYLEATCWSAYDQPVDINRWFMSAMCWLPVKTCWRQVVVCLLVRHCYLLLPWLQVTTLLFAGYCRLLVT